MHNVDDRFLWVSSTGLTLSLQGKKEFWQVIVINGTRTLFFVCFCFCFVLFCFALLKITPKNRSQWFHCCVAYAFCQPCTNNYGNAVKVMTIIIMYYNKLFVFFALLIGVWVYSSHWPLKLRLLPLLTQLESHLYMIWTDSQRCQTELPQLERRRTPLRQGAVLWRTWLQWDAQPS